MQKKDGWITVGDYDVYVEDGIVKRAMMKYADNYTTLYPYRKSRSGGWDREDNLTVSALRSGMRRGSIILS